MTGLGYFVIACGLGVFCFGAMHWYRQCLDTREGHYGWVWRNRRF